MNAEILGHGLTSTVQVSKFNGVKCAKKIFKDHVSLAARQKEIQMLQSFKHSGLVEMLAYDEFNSQWLLMELLQSKDLFDFVDTPQKGFRMPAIKYMVGQLANTLAYLHNQGVSHRDIKLENILVNQDFDLKICDLGFAEPLINEKVQRTVGTEGYLPPELQNYGQILATELVAADVFSLGVCIFILAFAHPPFKFTKTQCPYWRAIKGGKWETFWNAVDKTNQKDAEFRKLIQGMLEPEPTKRISLKEVLHFASNGCRDEYLKEMQTRRDG